MNSKTKETKKLVNSLRSSIPTSRFVNLRCMVMAFLFLLFLACIFTLKPEGQTGIEYKCPAVVHEAANADKSTLDEDYVTPQANLTQNLTSWLENFRTENFDAWGYTYEEVKAGMRPFKEKFLVPNIKSGQDIYESACGIGLNLYMTLEILHDAGITGIHVYGNEYLKFSTEKANLLFDHAPPAGSKKGMICVGDSSDLSHVPSNSFDLVYTGYISPLLNPLGLSHADPDDDVYTELCKQAKEEKNWKEKTLSQLAQEKQNDFYGKWVGEMVRIAKPGSAVLIEQVSYVKSLQIGVEWIESGGCLVLDAMAGMLIQAHWSSWKTLCLDTDIMSF